MNMEIARELNLTCAITDLIAGVILIPMIFLLCMKKTDKALEKKLWLYFLSLLAVSCFLGFVTHNYCTGRLFSLMWLPLYTVMFETVNAFFILARYLSSGKMPSKKEIVILHLICLAFWIVTETMEQILHVSPIRLYAAYAVIFGMWGFILVIKSAFKKGRTCEKLLLGAFILLIPAAYYQIERKTEVRLIWMFNYDGLTHLFIIFAMFLMFFAALCSLSKKPLDSDVTV